MTRQRMEERFLLEPARYREQIAEMVRDEKHPSRREVGDWRQRHDGVRTVGVQPDTKGAQ